MTQTIKWTVKKPFKYGGKLLKQGAEWKPTGGKYDASIMESPLVTRQVIMKQTKEPANGAAE